MGSNNYHTANYPTEYPKDAHRMLEVTTFDNLVEVRIYKAGDEKLYNQRVAVSLTKAQAYALIEDLRRAADYVFGDN